MSIELVRQFGGKAAFIAFMTKLGNEDISWEQLSDQLKEAWIAAAHEANMLQYIIENEKEEDPTPAA